MPTTYTNGLKLPDLGSIDWFNAYKNNIDILDPIVGTVNGVATTYAPISHNHDASEITSGTIDIARLPPAALERLTTVADQTARYALTTSTVQLGDTVKQLDTGIMYLVVDTTKLNSADGYVEYSAGTASKAIADEDGTSIKTGYVNVAGNQTVTGQKTWSGNNTWGTNLLTVKDSAFTKGTSVTDRKQNLWKFTDSNDSVFGIWEAIQYTSGKQGIRLNLTNKYKNGALDPTGNDTPVYFEFLQKESDGQTILKWANGLIDNGIYPVGSYSLGNAAYQWSSVYAQSYYYNGTQWGLDKANTWTAPQIFSGSLRFNNVSYVSGTPSENIFYSVLQWGGYVNNTWSAPFTINNAIRTNGYSDTSFRTYSQTSNTLTGFVHETNADASDISFRPIANGTHKLGSSSYQWSSVYAQTYYYNGTQWGLDKANVWTNTQTVTGNDKGWNIINPDIEKGVIPSTNKSSFVWWADKNNNFLGRICSRVHTDGTTMLWLSSLNYYKNGVLDPTGSSATTSLILGVDANAYKFVQINADFRPDANNTSNLGTSTNKWKTLNGINPGALSLPDLDNSIDITSTFNASIDKTQNTNSYTADFTGWLYVIWWTQGLTPPFFIYFFCTNSATESNFIHSIWGQTFSMPSLAYWVLTVIPVTAGKTYWFETSWTRASTDTKNLAYTVRKLPCLGNV